MAQEGVVLHLPTLTVRAMALPEAMEMPNASMVLRVTAPPMGVMMVVAMTVPVAAEEMSPLMIRVCPLLTMKILSSRSSTQSATANLKPGRPIPLRYCSSPPLRSSVRGVSPYGRRCVLPLAGG